MTHGPHLSLGSGRAVDDPAIGGPLRMPAHHLVTHGVVVGMTGSGKTGLVTVLAEEALRAGVPVLVLDVKGDLTNLLLDVPSFAPARLAPWVEDLVEPDPDEPPEALHRRVAAQRADGLREAGIDEAALAAYHEGVRIRVITPGSHVGEPLHLLSALERPREHDRHSDEAARASLRSAISSLLHWVGRDPDPVRSPDHVLLTKLVERRLRAGEPTTLEALLADLEDPPLPRIGAMAIDAYVSPAERASLGAAINSLIASDAFRDWREGATLDVGAWLTPRADDPRTPCVVLSVPHLDEGSRALVLGAVLDETLRWVRSLPGTHRLRAMVLLDEAYGYLPPHPREPPTKRALVALLKQARAYGVGVVVATQNPMDLDYRALGNAGLWCIGRLQTDADRARVVDGLESSHRRDRASRAELDARIKQLAPRWFLMRDVHADVPAVLFRPRQTISLLRGPLTETELARALAEYEGGPHRGEASADSG